MWNRVLRLRIWDFGLWIIVSVVLCSWALAEARVTVRVSPARCELRLGETRRLKAEVRGTRERDVHWEIEGESGRATGTLTEDGFYSAPATCATPAIVKIRAVSEADPEAFGEALIALAPVRVRAKPAVSRLATGESVRLKAKVSGAADARVTWSVEGGDRNGTVTEHGFYTAPETAPTPGEITVRACSVADPTKSVPVLIRLREVKISVRPTQTTVRLGEEQRFEAKVEGTEHKAVRWAVQGKGNGTISENGRYLPPARLATPATITIVATSAADPGKTATARVSVPAVNLSLTATGTPRQRRQRTISATVYSVVKLSLPLDPLDFIVLGPLFRGRSGKIYVPAGGAYQFSAKVLNTANTDVRWSVEGGDANGRISTDGLYETPATVATPRVVQVHAESVADPTKRVTALLHLPPVLVQAHKSRVALRMGTAVALEATVENSEDDRIAWSVDGGDHNGVVSPGGIYRAPERLTTPATVHVRAASVADPTKFARIDVAIAAVALDLHPDRAEVTAGRSLQLTARVSGGENQGVRWRLEPSFGSLTATGLYSAPRRVASPTIVRITANSASDPTKQSTAEVRVKPGG
jgi:hypothetical protein